MTVREDRGVQVEARTLCAEHVWKAAHGRSEYQGVFDGRIEIVEHTRWGTCVVIAGGGSFNLEPTDLVTLTDGGAGE